MEHYNVLIATPGTDFCAEYVQSLANTFEECQKRGLTFKWLNGRSSLVHHARELTITGGGLQLNPEDTSPLGGLVTYDKIIWIDSDIQWTVEDFFKIYDSEYDVITGCYMDITGQVQVHFWGHQGVVTPASILFLKAPIKIQSCGFGFIGMKSGVFEKLPRPWFDQVYTKVGETESGEPVMDLIGEDISWCIKAYEAQIDIYCDPTVLVNHMKRVPISWDYFKQTSQQSTD